MLTESEVLAALPSHGFLRRYVEYATERTDANVAYHLAGGLMLLSQAVPIDYSMPWGSPVYGNVYSMVVGGSSKSRKTSALNIAARLLQDALPSSLQETPGSQEGLIESLRREAKQVVLYPEFGEFLAKSEEGYFLPMKTTLTNLWDCYSADTEMLTETGWKGRGEVKVGEKVYSLNTESGKLELVPVLDVGERPVREGERMFVLKGQRTDIRTTEGHNFFIKYRNNGEPSATFLKKTGAEMAERASAYLLPLSALPAQDFAGAPLTDDELRFIAWFLTDGCLATPQKVVISQSKPDMVEEIRALLTRLGFDFRERVVQPGAGAFANSRPRHEFTVPKGTHSGSLARSGWHLLEEYLDKDIAPALHTLTREQFRTLWVELLKGDGDNVGNRSDGLYCNRKTQADAYTAMAAARGFATSYGTRVTKNGVTMYRVVVRDERWLQSEPSNAKAQRPTLVQPEAGEVVWCVTNRNHTVVTRRHGKVVIAGNCMPVGRALAKGSMGQITKPRLSVMAAVATDLLERHTEEADWTGGFVARFLTFYGEPERHFITPPMDDLQVKHSLAEWLRGLADFSVPMQTGEQANPPGMCKGMTPAAQQMWADWAAEEGKKTKGANTRVAASIARATSHAGKVAILLSWDIGRARSGETWHIGEAEVKSALAITSLHIKSVLELGERVTGSRDMRDRRAVLNAISTMAPTPLGVIIKRAALLKRRVVEVLDSLVEEQAVAVYTSSGRLSYLQSPEAQKLLLASDNIEEGAASLNIPRIVERHPAPRLTPAPQVPMANIVRPGEVVWAKPDDWVEGEDSVIYMEDEAP
jgi:hypothetical protein